MTHLTWESKSRVRGLQPPITGRMFAVLQRLHAAKADGAPLRALADTHPKTLRALEDRDWIVATKLPDGGAVYALTGRGEKALRVYSAPGKRLDGLCPTCGERPRGQYASGRRKAYCDECTRISGHKQFTLKGNQLKAETPCSRCHKRARLAFPSGKRSTYCAHCRKVLRRREKRRMHKRKLALIAAGTPPICLKCDQPVMHTDKVVYDYCREHYYAYQRAYQRAYMRRWRQAKGNAS